MQIQKFNVFGVNSLLHEWINVNPPGDRTYDPGNRVNIIEGMSDEGTNVIGDFPSLLTKSAWNNHIFFHKDRLQQKYYLVKISPHIKDMVIQKNQITILLPLTK